MEHKFELNMFVKPDLDDNYVKILHKDLTKYDKNARLNKNSGAVERLTYKLEQNGKTYDRAKILYFDLSLTMTQAQELANKLNGRASVLRYLLLRAD